MRVNIFCIPSTELAACEEKLTDVDMTIIKEVDQSGWHGKFYYSSSPDPVPVPWGKTYKDYFDETVKAPFNRSYWAAFVFTKDTSCYVLSYGKAHFYLRPFCDYDFGIDLAKRIANESDTRLTASRRFQGTKKKDIRSFANNTRLGVESGESVDYLQAGITDGGQATFGKSGKFGASALLTPEIAPAGIGAFLSKIVAELTKPARFSLPRTTVITESAEIAKYDQMLVDELTSEIGTSEFTHNSFDLYGVDFVFSNDGEFSLWAPRKPKITVEHLSVGDLKAYVVDNKVPADEILRMRVRLSAEESFGFNVSIKQAIDFIPDGERVLLTGGKWTLFNQDYLDFLNEFLSGLDVEPTEAEFAKIWIDEPTFNSSQEVLDVGYVVADKDFSIFKTRSPTPIEAWDLSKGSTVYAVKFGTAQKLGYVCDQATAVLELLRNRAGVKKVPDFDRYCIWLGYRGAKQLSSVTDTGSIILKQKIETWARKAREVGVVPVIKISRKMREGFDE